MADFYSTNQYANDANLDNAKMWDGDTMKQATWLATLDEDIEARPALRDIVRRGTVELRNGKTAVDSKAAIIAIQDGTAKKLRAHASCATPYPPGKYIEASENELTAIGILRTPDKYGKTIHNAKGEARHALDATSAADDDALTVPDAAKDLYVVQPEYTERVDADLAQFILSRISDRQKRRELKDEYGDDGRSMLAAQHIEVRNRSLGGETKIVDKLTKLSEKGLATINKKAFNAFITTADDMYVSLPMNSQHASDAMRAHRMIRVIIKSFKTKEEQLNMASQLEMRFKAAHVDKGSSTAVKEEIRNMLQEREDYLSDEDDDAPLGEALQANGKPRRDAIKTNAGEKPFVWKMGMSACFVCGMLGHKHNECTKEGWKPTPANCFAPPADYKVTRGPRVAEDGGDKSEEKGGANGATGTRGTCKMAKSSYESDVDEQIKRAFPDLCDDCDDEPYHTYHTGGAAKAAEGSAPVPTPQTLVPQFPKGMLVPIETGTNGEMYVPPKTTPLADDRVAKAQEKGKADTKSLFTFKLVTMILIVAVLGTIYGGHGGAQVKMPDPTACSCSFSSATSTWVCSYNGACGDHMYETMD